LATAGEGESAQTGREKEIEPREARRQEKKGVKEARSCWKNGKKGTPKSRSSAWSHLKRREGKKQLKRGEKGLVQLDERKGEEISQHGWSRK